MQKRLRIALLIDFLVSEYSEFLIDGVKECCKKVDADFYIFQMGELNNHDQNYDYQCVAITAFLSKQNIDGIIFISTNQTHFIDMETYISYIKSYYPIPIVNISGIIPDVPSVVVNYEQAFRNLIEHVVRDGKAKKIGFMSASSKSEEMLLREQIFWQVIKDYKIPFSSVTEWKCTLSYSSAMYELHRTETEAPFDYDAIICLNDDMALGCIDYIKSRGLRVPEDIFVTGFDNLRKSVFNIPSISTVDQKVFQQGYIAARTLYDQIVGKEVPAVQRIDAKAILRKSTGAQNYFDKVRNDKYIEIDRASLAEVYTTNQGYEWYQNRTQIYRVSKLFMDLKSNMSKDDIINYLNYNFHSLGIPYIVVVAYDKPIEKNECFEYFHLPHSAKIICSYKRGNNMVINSYADEIVFDPNTYILPEEYLPDTKNPVIAMALYNGKYQLGYMLVEKTGFDIAVYETIRRSLSLMVSSLIEYSFSGSSDDEIKEKYAIMDKIAHTDELTGIYNRRGFFEFGQKLLALSQSMLQKGLVIFCDMDGLKKINDNFGHESGDRAIVVQAGILKSSFRATDIVARLGGDEFAVISPGLSLEYFESIKKKIENRCIEWTQETNSLFLLGISLGAVEYPHNGSYDLQTLLSLADTDLYGEKRRKKTGRDFS